MTRQSTAQRTPASPEPAVPPSPEHPSDGGGYVTGSAGLGAVRADDKDGGRMDVGSRGATAAVDEADTPDDPPPPPPPFPLGQVLLISTALFANAYALTSVFPYAGFFSDKLLGHVGNEHRDTGYAAGWIGGSFMLGRVTTAMFVRVGGALCFVCCGLYFCACLYVCAHR